MDAARHLIIVLETMSNSLRYVAEEIRLASLVGHYNAVKIPRR